MRCKLSVLAVEYSRSERFQGTCQDAVSDLEFSGADGIGVCSVGESRGEFHFGRLVGEVDQSGTGISAPHNGYSSVG